MEYEDDNIEYGTYELTFIDRIVIAKLRNIMRANDNQKTMEMCNIIDREVRI